MELHYIRYILCKKETEIPVSLLSKIVFLLFFSLQESSERVVKRWANEETVDDPMVGMQQQQLLISFCFPVDGTTTTEDRSQNEKTGETKGSREGVSDTRSKCWKSDDAVGGTLFFSHQRLLVAKKEREVTVTIQKPSSFSLSWGKKKRRLLFPASFLRCYGALMSTITNGMKDSKKESFSSEYVFVTSAV